MRKLFRIFALALVSAAAMNFVACDGNEEVTENKLTVAPKALTFASDDAELQTVTVTSTAAWTAEAGAAWITVTPGSGEAGGTFTVTVEAATEARNGTITVKSGTLSETVAVNQSAPDGITVPVTGVELDETLLSMDIDDEVTLVATVLPADATNKKVTWDSSAPAIASVDENGLVKAIAAGQATITATTEDGEFPAACEVTVNAATIAVTSVELDAASVSIMTGAGYTLTATVLPAEATDKEVTWESSDEAVVTVEDGVVTAVGEGEATITVITDDGGHEAECTVTVSWLGAVTFRSETTWPVGTQVWSDAVMAERARGKSTYGDGATDADGRLIDCIENGDYADLFSWGVVNKYGDYMCPGDWRVPTMDDFVTLDKALGGTGINYQWDNELVAKYGADWGLEYCGMVNASNNTLADQGAAGTCWSDTRDGTTDYYYYHRVHILQVQPVSRSSPNQGSAVRCVK